MPPVKKIVMWLVVIFILYAILTQPTQAANIIGSIWDFLWSGIKNIGTFFNKLLK